MVAVGGDGWPQCEVVWIHPPSLCSKLWASSASCSGSLSKVGGGGLVGIDPVLVKAGDILRNSERASIPSLVPRSSGRERILEALSRMFRCWLYLGHSVMIWFLSSRVTLSQGQEIGSGDKGRKERLKSPV